MIRRIKRIIHREFLRQVRKSVDDTIYKKRKIQAWNDHISMVNIQQAAADKKNAEMIGKVCPYITNPVDPTEPTICHSNCVNFVPGKGTHKYNFHPYYGGAGYFHTEPRCRFWK